MRRRARTTEETFILPSDKDSRSRTRSSGRCNTDCISWIQFPFNRESWRQQRSPSGNSRIMIEDVTKVK